MRRASAVAFAIVAYLCFLTVIVWTIVFLADLAPGTAIDHGVAVAPATATGIDLLLLTVFALHHSVFARRGVRQRLARRIPADVDRAFYVLSASALLSLVLWQWRPIPTLIWDVRAEPWRALLWCLFALGWIVAVGATFMIDHLEFVGLRQAVSDRRRAAVFQARWLYALVRHPLMLGLLLAFWATPTMTWGHALFAAAFSGYIAIGIRFEERDLRAELGEPYRRYAARTPAIVPGLRRRRGSGAARDDRAADADPDRGRHAPGTRTLDA